jgi:chorismate mutase-like protein
MGIEDWRTEINAIDAKLLRLLNMRARIAIKVGVLKRTAGLPLNDAEREQEVLKRVRQANTGPLDDETVTRLFRRIIRESRRAQQSAPEPKWPTCAQEVGR